MTTGITKKLPVVSFVVSYLVKKIAQIKIR